MATDSSAFEKKGEVFHDNIVLSDQNMDSIDIDIETPTVAKKQKVPRRIIHFSDGVVEEYSTDEEEEEEKPPEVDPKTLTWLPWFWYYTAYSASRALNMADSCGEKLAWFFGITSPKYQYAIDEYERIQREEREELEREAREEEAERQRSFRKLGDMEGGSEGGSINLAYSHPTLDTAGHERY